MALEEFIIEASQAPKEPFSNVVGQDSLTRFDKPKQGGKKRRNKNRNKNKTAVAGTQEKKVAPPFKQAEFDIMYGEGISKVGEVIDLGVDFEIIKKSGSWFSYDDTKLGQGRDAVKALLLDNPELMEELEKKIKDAIVALNQ